MTPQQKAEMNTAFNDLRETSPKMVEYLMFFYTECMEQGFTADQAFTLTQITLANMTNGGAQ